MKFKAQLALGLIIGNYASVLFSKQDMLDVHHRALLIGTVYFFVAILGRFGPERDFLKDLFSVFTVLNVKRGVRNLHAPGAFARTQKRMKQKQKNRKFLRNPLKTHNMANRKKKTSLY